MYPSGMNADENLLNGLIPIEPSNVEFDEDATPHARFYQVLAWQTGTHPLVYNNQIWESLDEKDEVGPRQVMIVKLDGTKVDVINVDSNGKSRREGLGETDALPILSLRPEDDGKRGWVLKSVVVPVNANGEATPGVHIPYPQVTPIRKAPTPATKTATKTTTTTVSSPPKQIGAAPTTVSSTGAASSLTKSALSAVDRMRNKRAEKTKGADASAPLSLEDKVSIFGNLARNGGTLDQDQSALVKALIEKYGFIECMKTTRELLREMNVPDGTCVIDSVKGIFDQTEREAALEKNAAVVNA